jgi:hypothetical protein
MPSIEGLFIEKTMGWVISASISKNYLCEKNRGQEEENIAFNIFISFSFI